MPSVKTTRDITGTTVDAHLPNGPNGYVLTVDNTAPTGFNWTAPGGGGGSGTVTSVSGGNNVTITGTPTVAPVVNLSSPLTSTLNVGAQTISSSTGTIEITPLAGNDCNINCSGTGHLHLDSAGSGGAAQPLLVLENTNGNASGVHIDLYKNSSSPAGGDSLGAISFHGNNNAAVNKEYARVEGTLQDVVSGTEDGALSLQVVKAGTLRNALQVSGTIGEVSINPFGAIGADFDFIHRTLTGASLIHSDCGSAFVGINTSSQLGGPGTSLNVSGNVYASNVISSATDVRATNMRTNTLIPYTPVHHYPLTNATTPLAVPYENGAQLQVVSGTVPLSAKWSQLTTGLGSVYAMVRYLGNNFVAHSNYVSEYDNAGTLINQWSVTGGIGAVYAMTRDNGGQRLYVGGDFNTINGVSANNLAYYDYSTSSWYAVADSSGFQGTNGAVWCVFFDNVNTQQLFFGGDFSADSAGAAYSYGKWGYFSSAGPSFFSTTWAQANGGKVRAIGAYYDSGVSGNVAVIGGEFTDVNGSSSYQYICGVNFSISSIFGVGATLPDINGPVYSIGIDDSTGYVSFGGNFSYIGNTAVQYPFGSPTSFTGYAYASSPIGFVYWDNTGSGSFVVGNAGGSYELFLNGNLVWSPSGLPTQQAVGWTWDGGSTYFMADTQNGGVIWTYNPTLQQSCFVSAYNFVYQGNATFTIATFNTPNLSFTAFGASNNWIIPGTLQSGITLS